MTPPLRLAWTRQDRVPQPVLCPEQSQAMARARPVLPVAWRDAQPCSEPSEFAMVRRRSTVRFRKGLQVMDLFRM
jgi:hypothetical protein